MGFFSWVGGLIDDLIAWLGRAVEAFVRALVSALEAIWQTVVVGVLIAAFGFSATLYVIFYAGFLAGQTIMEIWDPRYYNSKPSEQFVLEKAPQSSPLPTQRNKARVVAMKNVRY